ncbi:superinfection immunity protein [Caballeronia sp. S22]|uniref:superinfection immunity protein n=1 Tax=Caballeronia sp. S22 TaxID=3137182 RepID=UPI003530CDC6
MNVQPTKGTNGFTAIVAYIYFFPAIIAYRRNNPDLFEIALFNLFFGWSAMGWVGALVWAHQITLRKLVAYITSGSHCDLIKSTLRFAVTPTSHRGSRKISVRSGNHATNF